MIAIYLNNNNITEQLLRQRAFLRDERRRLRISTEKIEERKNALKTMQRVDWIPDNIASSSIDRHIMINIGGLVSYYSFY